jgi:inner membrane protein
MDTLTHALSGALLARATAPRAATAGGVSLRRRIVVGALAAAFPDLDFVLGFISPSAYLLYHRGVTHSIIMLPFWAFVLAWPFARLDPARPRWQAYFWVVAGSLGIHILGDLITSFGTVLLAPFSDRRFAFDTTFIIDLWFSAVIVAALVAGLVWRRSRIPAVAGLAVLAGYVGLQAFAHGRAVEIGREYAQANGLSSARISAQPRPVSPFNWMIVVEDGDEFHYAFVNLVRTARLPAPPPGAGLIARLDAAYLPAAQAAWRTSERFGPPSARAQVREAWEAAPLGFFRWFAVYPVLHRIDHAAAVRCVWFRDLRFFTPGRDTWPFQYGVCRNGGDDRWSAFQLVGDSARLPLR